MEQKIIHGATLDIATPTEVENIINNALNKPTDSHYRREKGVTTLDPTGAGVISFTAPRLYDWVCQRVTVVAGAGGQVEFFENEAQPSDMLEDIVLNANGRYSDAFSNSLFVPAGSKLLVAFIGAGANGQAAVNLQIQLVRRAN